MTETRALEYGLIMWESYWSERGVPWEFDAGPPARSDWARLFAELPNYRGLGQALLRKQVFRWHHGPVFYRGRLGEDETRVLVIGQEGGQDEALAHRAFVGGSGAHLQHFLAFLGVTRSYLFLNTFFYPIFGQYDETLRWLAQGAESPIVQHRHAVFEYLVARNPHLDLVVSVGVAARESVQAWFKARGAPPHADSLHVHVMHPGATASGEHAAVAKSFSAAIAKIRKFASTRPRWLPADPGTRRDLGAKYSYGAAPIPFRDLPFGAPWRVGYGATTSNRRDGQRGIQIFSADGHYNNKGHSLVYAGLADGSPEGFDAPPEDLAYEPPRADHASFDRGPPARWAKLLLGGEPEFPWPDFAALGLPCHPSFGFGPIYRGRPNSATLVALADRDAHDDLLLGRALCGEDGQRLQQFLMAAGLTKSYLILRVLPVNSAGATPSTLRAALDHPQTRALYREAVQRCEKARVLLAIGPGAQRLVAHVKGSLRVVGMKRWSERGAAADWKRAHAELIAIEYPSDRTKSAHFDAVRGQVSRADLPYGTLRWQGSSGDRALQPKLQGSPSPDYFKLMIPGWVNKLEPAPLSEQENEAVHDQLT